MRIGVVGFGNVGQATAYVLCRNRDVEILSYDKFNEKGNSSLETVLLDSDIIFMALPTPMNEDGSICLTYIEDSLLDIEMVCWEHKIPTQNKLFVLRSTIIPGTIDYLKAKYGFSFAYMPEFLTERNANEDAMKSNRMVIGSYNKEDYYKLKSLFMPVLSLAAYINFTPKEAETYKYMANVQLAAQVAISNEIYFICQKIGVDYDKVRKALCFDLRIGSFTQVPGYDGDYGFGGRCFKKDMEAFVAMSTDYGYRATVLETILMFNDEIRVNKDWNDIPGAVYSCKYDDEEFKEK